MSGGLVGNAPLTASGRLILRKFAPMLEHFPPPGVGLPTCTESLEKTDAALACLNLYRGASRI